MIQIKQQIRSNANGSGIWYSIYFRYMCKVKDGQLYVATSHYKFALRYRIINN